MPCCRIGPVSTLQTACMVAFICPSRLFKVLGKRIGPAQQVEALSSASNSNVERCVKQNHVRNCIGCHIPKGLLILLEICLNFVGFHSHLSGYPLKTSSSTAHCWRYHTSLHPIILIINPIRRLVYDISFFCSQVHLQRTLPRVHSRNKAATKSSPSTFVERE